MHSLRGGVPGGAKSATACITSLHVVGRIILVDFNLAVSTPTAKLPNLIPRQIFLLYYYSIIPSTAVKHACAMFLFPKVVF